MSRDFNKLWNLVRDQRVDPVASARIELVQNAVCKNKLTVGNPMAPHFLPYRVTFVPEFA
jgi:hypothetical protein